MPNSSALISAEEYYVQAKSMYVASRLNVWNWVLAEWRVQGRRARNVTIIVFFVAVVFSPSAVLRLDSLLVGSASRFGGLDLFIVLAFVPAVAMLSHGVAFAIAVVRALLWHRRASRFHCRFCDFDLETRVASLCRDCGERRPLAFPRSAGVSVVRTLLGVPPRMTSPFRAHSVGRHVELVGAIWAIALSIYVGWIVPRIKLPARFFENYLGDQRYSQGVQLVIDNSIIVGIVLLVLMWMSLTVAHRFDFNTSRDRRRIKIRS